MALAKDSAHSVSVVILRVRGNLVLYSRSPWLHALIELVGLVVLCLLLQVAVFERLLATWVVKPQVTEVIVLRYQRRIIASLDLRQLYKIKYIKITRKKMSLLLFVVVVKLIDAMIHGVAMKDAGTLTGVS